MDGLSLEEVQELLAAVTKREEALRIVERGAEQIDRITREYGEAVGRKVGDSWVSPTGAHDAYPTGAVVEHRGSMWESLTAGNVWEPGVSGWREIAAEDAVPPAYRQPTGAHDAYSVGERISWRGHVYRSLVDGNVWPPDAAPDSWSLEGTLPEGAEPPVLEPEPEPEPEDPTPEPDTGVEAWVPSLPLEVGDRVEYNGGVYVVQQAHTTQAGWEPTNLPALFAPEET